MTTETLRDQARKWWCENVGIDDPISTDHLCELLQSVRAQGRREGAEEMRERAAQWGERWNLLLEPKDIRALPTIPEGAREQQDNKTQGATND